MYGNGMNTGAGIKVTTGGGVLAATGAPPVVWMLALATLLVVAGALTWRNRRIEPSRTVVSH